MNLDPEEEGLERASGVYVIWHAGSRPEWLYVGSSNDLARAFHAHGIDKEILSYEMRGGVFVTWALIREEFQGGAVRYLTEELQPVIANPQAPGSSVRAIAVQLPGRKE